MAGVGQRRHRGRTERLLLPSPAGKGAVAAGCASPPTPALRYNAPTVHALLPPLPPYIPSASPLRGTCGPIARLCSPLRAAPPPISAAVLGRTAAADFGGSCGAPPAGLGVWWGKTGWGWGKRGVGSAKPVLLEGLYDREMSHPHKNHRMFCLLHLFFSLFWSGWRKSLGFISVKWCHRKVKRSFPNGVIARCRFYLQQVVMASLQLIGIP